MAPKPNTLFQVNVRALSLHCERDLYISAWRDLPVIGSETCSACGKGHGYFTIDVAASYKINHYLSVYARADNLLNRQFEDPIGYLQPGRAGYGGFTLSY